MATTPDRALAIDIGGSKMAAAVVDRTGNVARRRMVPTPATSHADALFAALADLVEPLVRDATVVGVGCGGPMAPGGERVSPLNIPAWRDFPLRARLADLTALPVAVDNDAKALAPGE